MLTWQAEGKRAFSVEVITWGADLVYVCDGEKGESSHTQDLPAGFAVGKVGKMLNNGAGHMGQKCG